MRHGEDVAVDVLHTAVHHADLVREQAHPDNLAGHPVEVGGVVAGFETSQQQQSGSDFADRYPIDMHGGLTHSLQDHAHDKVLLRRAAGISPAIRRQKMQLPGGESSTKKGMRISLG